VANLGAMSSEAPTCSASAQACGNGDFSIPCPIGELVASQRRQMHPDIAGHPESALQAVPGIAFGRQRRDEGVTFLGRRALERLTRADPPGTVRLRESPPRAPC
jgi:hypothetical protein